MITFYRLILSVTTALLMASAPAFACEEHDRAAIHNLMMQQWNKPDTPLSMGPIAIEGQFALLGWSQGENGGRAFLRKTDKKWEITFCGGDDLVSQQALIQAGMSAMAAEQLLRTLAHEESAMSSHLKQKFSLFEGITPVHAAQHGDIAHHGSSAHHQHQGH